MYILAEIRYQFLIWLNLSFTNAGTVSKSCGDSLSRDSTPTKIMQVRTIMTFGSTVENISIRKSGHQPSPLVQLSTRTGASTWLPSVLFCLPPAKG